MVILRQYSLQQVIYAFAQKVALSFPESTRKRYTDAAATFRIPYWDWAILTPPGDTAFPQAIGGSATVKGITPKSNGVLVDMPNPLYQYTFKPLNPVRGDFPFAPVREINETNHGHNQLTYLVQHLAKYFALPDHQ